jgi:hypothetical protein
MIYLLDHPPLPSASCLSFSVFLSPVELSGGRGEVWGWTRSQTIQPQESLALYKSFNNLCSYLSFVHCIVQYSVLKNITQVEWLKELGFDHAFNYKKVGIREAMTLRIIPFHSLYFFGAAN